MVLRCARASRARELRYEKKVDLSSLPEPTLRSARACSDRPALIKFAQLGERRFLNGKKFARLGG